jgi:RNA polymerase sigma-70 factor (ECF subfamily)
MSSDPLTAVSRARAGDAEAFRLIFNRYARPVVGFLQTLVGNYETAEELAQETFVRAYKNLDGLREDDRVATWLFGIARNVARESFRAKGKNDVSLEEKRETGFDPEHDGPQPEAAVLNKELNRHIQEGIAQLDEDKRTVFSLKVFQECSYEEIVEITGFTLAKVKTDLHRAKAEMRRYLRPYLGSES